ncbi:MAG: LysM peptidoglycan-binding domain-containing protein [Deltaproteobacteria bacterium]|nr:LysM peptidoglycan-binding domain-containing protein [Deltaproteobacteria bacterium]
MNCSKIIRTIICLWTFTAIITLPLSLSAQESKNTLEHETGFYYTIQKGDTLWDLSQRFFDSPWQWPGLWNENNQIANPHLIYPGERIRLLHKRWIKNISVKTPIKSDKKEAPYYTYSAIDSIGFIRKEQKNLLTQSVISSSHMMINK